MRRTRQSSTRAALAVAAALAVLWASARASRAGTSEGAVPPAEPDSAPACAAGDLDQAGPAQAGGCGIDLAILGLPAPPPVRKPIAARRATAPRTIAAPARILSVAPKTSPPPTS